jgi:peptidyl-prolyl cis-trans isomerase D
MLRILREGQRWITLFFILAVGGGMVFYLGIGGRFGNRSPGSIVVVGNESFGTREFARARARRQSMLEQQLGANFDAREMSDTLDQIAVQTLVEGAILSQQASALGIAVSKNEIERSISSSPYFAGANGQFDPAAFKSWVEWEFGNQRNFIREQRSMMLANRLMRTLTEIARVSDGEARQAATRRLEQVQIAFVTLTARPPAGYKPDPEALQAFLKSRDAELRSLYESRSSLYNMPEQVRARHILLSLPADASPEQAEAVRQRALDIIARIRAGEDFATLAKELSDDPGSAANGGDLGFFARGQMAKEFEDKAFALEPGKISEPVRTDYGYHIIEVEEHRPAQKRSFEEVREALATELMGLEVARTEKQAIADRIAEAIRGGASLEDAARAEGLTLQRSDRLQRRPDGYIPGIGTSPAVMAAAFNTAPGTSSDRVFEVDRSMVLIEVLERIAPEAAAVQAAVEQERSVLTNQKQEAYISGWINQTREELAEHGKLIVNLASVRGNG